VRLGDTKPHIVVVSGRYGIDTVETMADAYYGPNGLPMVDMGPRQYFNGAGGVHDAT